MSLILLVRTFVNRTTLIVVSFTEVLSTRPTKLIMRSSRGNHRSFIGSKRLDDVSPVHQQGPDTQCGEGPEHQREGTGSGIKESGLSDGDCPARRSRQRLTVSARASVRCRRRPRG